MTDLRILASSVRTLLFVPGDRPDRFAKAVAARPGVVMVDLEDAVPAEAKDTARRAVVGELRSGRVHGVRINAVGTEWHEADLASVSEMPCVVMLPKAQDPAAVAAVAANLAPGSALVALVETAAGILTAPAVAAASGVARLAFGSFDLAAELGVSPEDWEAMAACRAALVLASAAANIAAPIDGVTAAVGDHDALSSDVQRARRLGYSAKLCVHPRQVAIAAAALAPTEDELRWATAVMEAAESAAGSVVMVEGRMVDKPVVSRAARIVASARGPR